MSTPKKQLTLDIIYGPQGKPDDKVPFDGKFAKELQWLEDGVSYVFRFDERLCKGDAESGVETPAFDHDALRDAIAAHPDFTADEAKNLAKSIRPEEKRWPEAIIEHKEAVYQINVETRAIVRLSPPGVKCSAGCLSPKGSWLGFHADGDLYTWRFDAERQTRLTDDGDENVLNGKLDWVHQEEVYGRSKWRAYWWRDDEAYIAYLRLDQTAVPSFTIIDHREQPTKNETYRYPKPGEPNAKVRLGVTRPDAVGTTWVDLSRYDGQDIIICRVGWAPDGRLTYQAQDREGCWLELSDVDPETGASRLLVRETTAAWVNPLDDPGWLADGSFLWRSERDGWAHLYRYSRDGELLGRVTEGEWEVRRVHGVCEKTGWIYFDGTRDTELEEHLYRVPLAGGDVERLSEPGSTHSVVFNKQLTRCFDTFHNIKTPPKVHLRDNNGALLRIVSANEVAELDEYDLVEPEFHRAPADNGFLMNLMVLRPRNVAAGAKLPVMMETYSGPHAPCVGNRWYGAGYLYHQLLVQQGYMVVLIDPESASSRGAVSSWKCYKRLGVTELQDIEAGIRWLGENTPADLSRVGLHGWSYGGFMTSFAMTHSTMFKMGVAGAAPTDWRLYDTVYTERFMQTPANNPEGYDETSVVKAAGNLHGQMLLVHGTLDDNVHLQNAMQFVFALQKAGKAFDLMVYPGNQHGVRENARHWVQTRYDYIREHL